MKKIATAIALTLLLAVFLGVNIVAGRTLGRARLDLTEGRVYSLSDAGARIARSPDEFVKFTLYASRKAAEDQPALLDRVAFIEEKLAAFSRAGGEKVRLEVIDPEPDSSAEDEAVAAGLSPVFSSAEGGRGYLGLVATNALDAREVVPAFNVGDPNFERFLEFEIAKLIERLGTADKPRVGLLTSLPMRGSLPNPMTGQPGGRPYFILDELEAQFEVVDVEPSAAALPEDLSALLVVHPKNLLPATQYAIDQYLMRGGKAVFFIDPLCEVDFSGLDPSNPLSAISADRASASIDTLTAWGVSVREAQVAADLGTAMELPSRAGGGAALSIPTLALGEAGTVSADDPVTGSLEGRMIWWLGGAIDRAEDAKVEVEWLVRTSERAATVDAVKVSVPGADPAALLAGFVPQGERLTLAARLRGEGVPSAFPDGPPAEAGAVVPEGGHLAASTGPVHAVLVADADVVTDRLWVREMSVGGLVLGYQRFSDNGAFVTNVVDAMAGSGDLIALRGRGRVFRPLKKLDEMEREAESAIAAQVAALEERVDEAQQRINEIQRGRADSENASSLYLTPEQEEELQSLRAAQQEARAQIRSTRLDLRRDVETLKTRYLLINTAMVPGVLCLLAFGLGGYRAVRRRADRRRGGDR